jgi:hypothetical protein
MGVHMCWGRKKDSEAFLPANLRASLSEFLHIFLNIPKGNMCLLNFMTPFPSRKKSSGLQGATGNMSSLK